MKPAPSLLLRAAVVSALACLALHASLPAMRAQNSGEAAVPAVAPRTEPTGVAKRAEKFLLRAHTGGVRTLQLSQLAAERATDPQVKAFARQLVGEHQQMALELKPLLTAAGLDRREADPAATNPAPAADPAGGAPATGLPSATTSSTTGATGSGVRSGTGAQANEITGEKTLESAGTAGTAGGSGHGVEDPATYHNPAVRDRWSRMLDDRKQRRLMEKTGADFDEAYLNLMIDEHQEAVALLEDGAEGEAGADVQAFAAKYLPKLREHLVHAEAIEKNLK